MSKRKPELLLLDIIEAGEKINTYTAGFSYDQFCSDPKTIDAVIRNFEIIGEAANRLHEDFRVTHDSVDWHRIRGFRNRIVHDYFGIDLEIVWAIMEDYLPELITRIKSFI